MAWQLRLLTFVIFSTMKKYPGQRRPDTRGADLTFANRWPQILEANVKCIAPPATTTCQWSFDSDIRKGARCKERANVGIGPLAVSRSEIIALLKDHPARTPEARIVRCMSERGAITAADLARATGLARSTISMALSELRSA